ncbi:protein phosphatase PTC7 homolog isoform X2 [Tigriopus californicus]|nr:protein phosphatase PTC7 homolog isoform X2 [Tigriopus californicus]
MKSSRALRMQTTLGCLSRLVSRSFVSGVVNTKEPCHAQNPHGPPSDQTRLVTAVSGFPKQKTGYNIDHILKGQIGEDAYFVARHVDDWNNNLVDETMPQYLLHPEANRGQASPAKSPSNRANTANTTSSPMVASNAGVQSLRNSSSNSADVIGVADGVGGWRQYGVDPGLFSSHLMKNCERLVKAGYLVSNHPAKLLAQGFREMKECKQQIMGSSTACVMMLSHADLKLYTANIGDSGFLVVRRGEVVHRSQEQQHSFNTPFQLSLPPSEMASDVLSDHPESADRYEFNVEDGDVIMLATDGIFDNVPDSLLVDEISAKVSSPDLVAPSHDELTARLQQCANSIALIARKLSQDPDFLSPFAQNARANGFRMSGGKEDDITVLLAAVRIS